MGTDVLSEIVENKRREVDRLRRQVPEKRLREMAAVPRLRRSLRERLQRPGVNIIAEVKRASPSKGIIRAELDSGVYAAAYQRGGAAAVSVLTDTHYFRGSPDDLIRARQAVSLPVLRKDFTVSAYQIYESAVMGADAILLIARILSEDQLEEYLSLSASLGLEALVEIHTEKEVEVARRVRADLVGINNRNLSSFDTDVQTAQRLAQDLDEDQVVVAASGIKGPADVAAGLRSGIHNFLVGESIVRAPDPAAFVHRLLQNSEPAQTPIAQDPDTGAPKENA
jgi:indole-3-glycerol phosphate synthase